MGISSAPEAGAKGKAKRRSGRRAKEKAAARAAGDVGGVSSSEAGSAAAVLVPVAGPLQGADSLLAGVAQQALAPPLKALDGLMPDEALCAPSTEAPASAADSAVADPGAGMLAAAALAPDITDGASFAGISSLAPGAPPEAEGLPTALPPVPFVEAVGPLPAALPAPAGKGANPAAEEAVLGGSDDCALHEVLALLQMGALPAAVAPLPAPTAVGGSIFAPPALPLMAPPVMARAGDGSGSAAMAAWGPAATWAPVSVAGEVSNAGDGVPGVVAGSRLSAPEFPMFGGPGAGARAVAGSPTALPAAPSAEGGYPLAAMGPGNLPDSAAMPLQGVEPSGGAASGAASQGSFALARAGGLGAAASQRMEGEFICPITQVGMGSAVFWMALSVDYESFTKWSNE